MVLFHVSFSEYVAGQTYYAPNPTGYHLRSIDRNEGWINELLDLYRPKGMPSRISSFYTCSQLENCQAFIGNKKIDSKNPIYYKVEMDCEHGFPMVLTDKIRKLGRGSKLLGECVNEYWSPIEAWKYLEYLSPSMTIIEVLPIPNHLMILKGTMNYSHDRDLANKLFH
jgi:hypothetical protein